MGGGGAVIGTNCHVVKGIPRVSNRSKHQLEEWNSAELCLFHTGQMGQASVKRNASKTFTVGQGL